MDPIRNPYAPGAGQRPPELAGRDEQLDQFKVVLQRIARGRPERSIVLTGLRGVGKTVLLNALRSEAVRAKWGTGKFEARPDQRLRRPISSALHQAVRELGHPQSEDVDHVLGVIKAFAQRDAAPNAKLRDKWSPGIDAPAVSGRADSGDIEIDLVELLSDAGGLAADMGRGLGIFIDEMQDLHPEATRSASPVCRSSSSAPACRTCRRCCRRPSLTPSGCSVTHGSIAFPARRPTVHSRVRRRTRTPSSSTALSMRCTR